MNPREACCVEKKKHPCGTRWEDLRNGKLLAAAAAQFDVLLTVDQNIKHQQNLATLPIAVVVMIAPSNTLEDLALLVPEVEEALQGLQPKTLVEVSQ